MGEETLEEMKEKNEELVEKIEKSKKDHEEEKERMKRKYEAQSSSDGEKMTKANERIVNLETESKRARSHFNERMREQEKLRINAENEGKRMEEILTGKEGKIKDLKEMVRKLEENKIDEVSILDKEKVIEKQNKFIEEMEKDVALKRLEIDAWRKNCLLFWEENPNTIFDPNDPYRTTKADSKGHEEGKEGMIRKLKEKK